MNSFPFATNLQNKTKQVDMKNNNPECFDQGEKQVLRDTQFFNWK